MLSLAHNSDGHAKAQCTSVCHAMHCLQINSTQDCTSLACCADHYHGQCCHAATRLSRAVYGAPLASVPFHDARGPCNDTWSPSRCQIPHGSPTSRQWQPSHEPCHAGDRCQLLHMYAVCSVVTRATSHTLSLLSSACGTTQPDMLELSPSCSATATSRETVGVQQYLLAYMHMLLC